MTTGFSGFASGVTGRIERLPRRHSDLLEVGNDLSLDEVEALHPETQQEADLLRSRRPGYRWWFPWKEYAIIGIPDGISRTTVLEKKEAANGYLAATVSRPVAKSQADIYGHFFKRMHKVVSIHVKDTREHRVYHELVDSRRALETLEKFRAVDRGKPPIPPKPHKCTSCELRDSCPIRQS